MAKIIFNNKRQSTAQIREAFKNHYINKFFNIWMNKFKFEGLNYQQIDYIMRKFWSEGTIACTRPVGIPNNLGIDMKEDSIIFTPWVMNGLYNIYDFPTEARCINTRAVNFVNPNPLEIDSGIVIGYIQRNKKGVYSSIETKVNELVDIEMILRISLKSSKMPWLFTTTPENKTAVEKLAKDFESDDPTLFTTLEEAEKGKGFSSGSPYISDKLEQMRQKVEDDIMTFLGKKNVGIAEKKEHLIVGEVEANNQIIEEADDEFLDLIQEFFGRVKDVFGYDVSVSLNHDDKSWYNENEEKEEVEDVD